MTARVLNGKEISGQIKAEVADDVRRLREKHGIRPCLSLVQVGRDPASEVYVGSKIRTCDELGMKSEHHHLPESVGESELLSLIATLNERDDVDGILVQLPLPKHINEGKVLAAVAPEKDVDGFHPMNVGRLWQGEDVLAPCTPSGVIEILRRSNVEMNGAHAVIIGRSNIVGKPMAALLVKESATVTICHSRTKNLEEISSKADILVAAIGRAGFVCGNHVKKGATVIDVGINKFDDIDDVGNFFGDDLQKRTEAIEKRGFTLIGDVNPREVIQKAGAITPVPGGVGLLTVAMLMRNTVKAAKQRRGLRL
jgi:methylenetetrahydrofolate dehydrogenase (NADP+)/methenyltetrahydrofolate cyclohydrolase